MDFTKRELRLWREDRITSIYIELIENKISSLSKEMATLHISKTNTSDALQRYACIQILSSSVFDSALDTLKNKAKPEG